MAKNFKRGLDSLIGKGPAKRSTAKKEAPAKRSPGRPKTSSKILKDTTEEGTRPGEKRATFIVREDLLEKVKAIAYWDRVKIKDVMDAAMEKHIQTYEKKHGKVKPVK